MEPYNKNHEKANAPQSQKSGWLPSGSALAGTIIVIVGAAILMKQLSYYYDFYYPRWLFSWPMILIIIGLYTGARSQFRNWGWLVPFAIGAIFLSEKVFRSIDIARFAIPTVIIAIGLYMIFRPKKKKSTEGGSSETSAWDPTFVSNEAGERLDIVSIVGGAKKNILSKNFKGGDVTSFFGGTEINLMQADINGVVMLDITCVFGGAKLIVPSHWKIQTDTVNIFGGVDDKRQLPQNQDSTKTLVLDGTVMFGGIEIKSY